MQNNPGWRWFMRVYLVFFVIGLLGLLLFEKGDLVLWFAEHRSGFFNNFFANLTLFGDGRMIVPVLIIALLVRYKYALILLACGLGQLISAAFFKRVVFGNQPRPMRYFEEIDPNWLIEGVEVHSNYAFPSGHTITGFSLSLFIALMFRNWKLGIFMAFVAIGVALSRVYLFQHFLADVVAGSIIGTLVSAGIFTLFMRWEAFWKHPALNKSLLGKAKQQD